MIRFITPVGVHHTCTAQRKSSHDDNWLFSGAPLVGELAAPADLADKDELADPADLDDKDEAAWL